jgi:hypothetical protein
MFSEVSPTMMIVLVGAPLAVLIGLYLLFVRRKNPSRSSAPQMLGLEAPKKAAVPARSNAPVVTEPAIEQTPPELLDPESARLHERAKRRARTVVREIMMYNEEKLEKGRKEGNLMKYLGREIELSRKLYQASIELSDADSSRYFDESLLNILAGGDARLLEEP